MTGTGCTAAFADVDVDGDVDAFVTCSTMNTSRLLLNNGTGYYSAVTSSLPSPLSKLTSAYAGAVADVNNDGLVDWLLYVDVCMPPTTSLSIPLQFLTATAVWLSWAGVHETLRCHTACC